MTMGATEGFSSLRRKAASFFAWMGPEAVIFRASQAVAAMLGLAGPIVVGAMAGHTSYGMVASLGGLALSGGVRGDTVREQVRGLLYLLAAGSMAMLVGSGIAGQGMITAAAAVAVSVAAGLLGSISRPLARSAPVFMLFTIIAANLGDGNAKPLAVMLLFCLGATWTAGLSLTFHSLVKVAHPALIPENRTTAASPPKYSARQLLRRWRKSLAHWSGWQYTLRIAVCLSAGLGFEWIWPHHHGYWVLIIVVIVVQRRPDAVLTRTFHRAAGTALGVLLTSLLLLGDPTIWTVIAMIAVLAAARPILMEVHYAAYAVVQTPLVILLLDFGQTPSGTVIVDRLVATLVGCALALTLGYLGWSRISPPIRSA